MFSNGFMSESDFQVAIEQFYRVSSTLHDEWQIEGIPLECHMNRKYLKRRTQKWMKVSSSWKQKRESPLDSEVGDHQGTAQQDIGSEARDVVELKNWMEDEAEYKTKLEEKDDDERSIYCHLEHNIIYSHSYGVPVVYFNVFLPSGELLTLDDLWENSLAHERNNRENCWTFITQQEHPFLRRPFFHFHPCHTANLMAKVQCLKSSLSPGLYLLSWLSSIAPFIHLDLSLAYGREMTDQPTTTDDLHLELSNSTSL